MAESIKTETDAEFKVVHLCAGLGGGAQGFQKSRYAYRGIRGRFRTLAGIDNDQQACEDFEKITGMPAVCMDLFTEAQYTAFHGHRPPEDWNEATPEDIRRACRNEFPDVVFTSSPCKGMSALLPQKTAETAKYQALNELTLRCAQLTMDAWHENLPSLYIFENVPRITLRGAELLKRIKRLLSDNGYVFHEGFHDCGEYGGLGQHRKRYLLIARNEAKMPVFVHKPYKKRVKSIGEVLERLSLPDAKEMGPMHRLPRLTWKTWVRLALIPAGKDWRALQEFAPSDDKARKKWEQKGEKTAGEKHLFKGKYGIIPWGVPGRTVIGGSSNGAGYVADPRLDHCPRGGGNLGVQEWDKPGAAVIGNARINGSNAVSVADVRLEETLHSRFSNKMRVLNYDETATTVTGIADIQAGAQSVADPRLPAYVDTCTGCPWSVQSDTASGQHGASCGAAPVGDHLFSSDNPKFNHAFKVTGWNETAGVVAGGGGPSCGGTCVADPMLRHSPRPGCMKVQEWAEPSSTVVASSTGVGVSNGASAVADPRAVKRGRHTSHFKVVPFNEASGTVTGATHVANGAVCVADVRMPKSEKRHPSVFQVVKWEDPAPCVTGTRFGSGSPAISDPRLAMTEDRFGGSPGLYGVNDWQDAMPTVTGSMWVSRGNCPSAVADPRLNCSLRSGAFGVMDWEKSSTTIGGSLDVHEGSAAVADPRLNCSQRGGTYGVMEWDKPSTTISASLDVHAGAAAIADPRQPEECDAAFEIPADNARLDPPPMIISLDNTWHRPLTTLELAALQGFDVVMKDGSPLVLSGKSDAKWRERIGNAVPPPAAEAIGEFALMALLTNMFGDYILASTEIWVNPPMEDNVMIELVSDKPSSIPAFCA